MAGADAERDMNDKDELRSVIRAIVREELAALIKEEGFADPIRNGDRGKFRPEPESEPPEKCAYCEGFFPESALNYSGGDPACAPCQATVAPPPLRTGY